MNLDAVYRENINREVIMVATGATEEKTGTTRGDCYSRDEKEIQPPNQN